MLDNQGLEQLRALVGELIRIGTVTSTNDEDATARVQFADRNDVVSYRLPVVVRNTRDNQDYWMPDINEKVLCLFLPIGVEQGFIIGSYYSRVTRPPVSTKDKRRVNYSDGAWFEYDRQTSTLNAYVPGDMVIEATGNVAATIGGNLQADVGGDATVDVAGTTSVTSPTINLTGTVNITGPLNLAGPLSAAPGGSGGGVTINGSLDATNDVTASGVSLVDHTHTDSTGGTTTDPN